MTVSRSKSREAAMDKAIEKLNECFRRLKGKRILFMVSGGSAFELLDGIDPKLVGRRVTMTVLDERYSKDPAVNNFSQMVQTGFYKKAERRGIDYIDTRVHRNITLYGLAKKFERALKRWQAKYPNGHIIITQGIGEDGHTAGIFPYAKQKTKFVRLFEDKKRWVIGYNAPRGKEFPRRITVSLPFLREQVDYAVVYATGSAKRKAVNRTLAKKGTLEQTPARVIHEMKNAHLFTSIT